MKKILLTSIVLISALLLGSYYAAGIITEKNIRNNINAIDQSAILSISLVEYKRGWFNSEAKLKWHIQLPSYVDKNTAKIMPGHDFEGEIPVEIKHGPLFFFDNQMHLGLSYAFTKIGLPQIYNKQFDEFFTQNSIKPQIDISYFINYLNKSRIKINVPKFTLEAKHDKANFDFDGLKSLINIPSNQSKLKILTIINGFQFNVEDTFVKVKQITRESNLTKNSLGLYIGQDNFSFAGFESTYKDKKMFALSDLSIISYDELQNGLLRVEFITNLKNVWVENQNYGPMFMRLYLNNLNAKALANFMQQLRAKLKEQQELKANYDPVLATAMLKMLSNGAVYAIPDFTLQLPQGLLSADLRIIFPQSDSENPINLILGIKGTGKVVIPEGTLKYFMQKSIMHRFETRPEFYEQTVKQWQADQQQKGGLPINNTNPPNTPPMAQENAITGAAAKVIKEQSEVDDLQAVKIPLPSKEELSSQLAVKEIEDYEQKGILKPIGNNYVTEFSYADGKLLINGREMSPTTR